MLFRQIGTIVLVVGMGEELQNFLKPDPTFQIAPQPLTLAPIKVKPHPESITVIPWGRLAGRTLLTDGTDLYPRHLRDGHLRGICGHLRDGHLRDGRNNPRQKPRWPEKALSEREEVLSHDSTEAWLAMSLWRNRWSAVTWRAYLDAGVAESQLTAIRRSTYSRRPLGSQEFTRTLEKEAKRRLAPQKRGPRKKADRSDNQEIFSFGA
jgi:hypothetical protein